MEGNETPAGWQPAPEQVIDDLDTLRVIADPLRIQILQATLEAPRTVKQIAAQLDLPVAKLYYHVNTLEEHRLLRVAGTRVVSGIIEKQYRATVQRLRFDRSLLAEPAMRHEAVHLMLDTVLETTRQDIAGLARALAEGQVDLVPEAPPERKVVIAKTLARLTPAQIGAFQARLRDLLGEFHGEPDAGPAARTYSLAVLLYPLPLAPPDDGPAPPAD